MNWTFTESPASRIEAAETTILSHVARYTLQDRTRYVDLRQELNVMSMLDRVAQYRLKRLENLNRMDDWRISKQLLNYKPRGVGHPRTVSYTHLDVYKRQV